MKVVSFQCYLIFHTSRTIFWLEYLWYSRARIYFPATYFLYFVAQIARIPSLFFCEYHERQTFLTQKTFSFAYLWVKEIAEKLEEFECWMVKWSSRNEVLKTYNPGQNYLRIFTPPCTLSNATTLFQQQLICGTKFPSPQVNVVSYKCLRIRVALEHTTTLLPRG